MRLLPILTRLFCFCFLSSYQKTSNGREILKAAGEADLLNIVYEAVSEFSSFPSVERIIFFYAMMLLL